MATALNHFNLRSFDLNLLVAFDALMRERNVTRAAARLKIQQPAMSHSLSTLRMLLDDELFVRVGHVMQPTARAEALSEHVAHILEQTQRLIESSESFSVETTERTFHIAFSSEELLLLPLISRALESAGPGLRMIAQRIPTADVSAALDAGSIDLAIGCYADMPARYVSRELYRQELACCYNPQLWGTEPIDADRYQGARHVTVSPVNGLDGCTSANSSCKLEPILTVPDTMTAFAAAAASRVVVSLPRHVAERYAAAFGLSVCPVPFEVSLRPVSMMWTARADREPASKWLRLQVMTAADELA